MVWIACCRTLSTSVLAWPAHWHRFSITRREVSIILVPLCLELPMTPPHLKIAAFYRQPSVFATAFGIIDTAGLHLCRLEKSQVGLELGYYLGSQDFGQCRGILDKGDAEAPCRTAVMSRGLFVHWKMYQISSNRHPIKGLGRNLLEDLNQVSRLGYLDKINDGYQLSFAHDIIQRAA